MLRIYLPLSKDLSTFRTPIGSQVQGLVPRFNHIFMHLDFWDPDPGTRDSDCGLTPKVRGRKILGMKLQGWKCGDENAGDEKSGDENVGMKMRGWKCRNEKSWYELSGDKKSGDEKTGDENAGMKLRGWSVTQPFRYVNMQSKVYLKGLFFA